MVFIYLGKLNAFIRKKIFEFCNIWKLKIVKLYIRFPLNCRDILKMWIIAIERKDFKPTKSHLICSAHFKASDFLWKSLTQTVCV